MASYRAKWARRRLLSAAYFKELTRILANPLAFYGAVLSKIIPSRRSRPLRLRLKDGKELEIREFWSLFLFDEIFVQRCYEAPAIVELRGIKNVIDVGANIGFFTVRAKQIWPDARILAFEPHPDNYAHLKRHVELNQLGKVTLVNEGLSEECGAFDLYLSGRNIGGHSLYKKTPHSIRIRTGTLADAIDRFGEGAVCDLLKIDCEGCEHAILSSLTPALAARLKCIIFEPETRLYDLGELKTTLARLGFAVSNFGDLVVAIREPGVALSPREDASLASVS